MNVLRICCSPRGAEAESFRLSEQIIHALRRNYPALAITDRMIGIDSIPHIDGIYAVAHQLPVAETARNATIVRSEMLIGELERADAVIIATPMHNLGVPSVLKAWIDHVVRAGRTFHVSSAGKAGTLRDKPVLIAVSSGGIFTGEGARQADFLTPYLKNVLNTIGLQDLTFFTVQGTGLAPAIVAATRASAYRAVDAHVAAGWPKERTR